MTKLQRTARQITTTGLGGAGILHLLWAAGTSWPTATRDELADLVVGTRPFPSTPMTLGVVGAIGAGIALVELESRAAPKKAGQPPTTPARLRRIAALGVPTVLALRGFGGFAVSKLELGTVTPQFRTWDLRLYSPLCIALALTAALAVATIPPPGAGVGRYPDPVVPHGRRGLATTKG